MKKSTKILLCASAVLISLGMILAIGGLIAGAKLDRIFGEGLWTFGFYEERTSEFSQDGHYAVSADGIDQLTIDWCAGNVFVEPYEGQEIILEEACSRGLNEKNALTFEADGSTLRIRSSSGTVGFYFGGVPVHKDLHIRVPKDVTLSEIDFNAGDADLHLQDMSMGTLHTETAAGDVFLQQVSLEAMKFDSASGNLKVEATSVAEVEMNTAAGDFTGDLLMCPQWISFNATSGDVELRLPADSQFTVQKDNLVGGFQSEFEGTYRDGVYTVGDGSSQIEMKTLQGSLQLLKASVS